MGRMLWHILKQGLMMPEMDGITVLKKLREQGNQTPVLMLTAKSEIDDKVLTGQRGK